MIVKVKSEVIKVLSIKMFTILLPRHQFGKKSCSCYKVQTYLCVKIEHVLYIYVKYQMSRLMGKPTICIGENKDADQLRGNREADQRLCFRYSDSTILLLLKSKISSL